MRALAEFAEEIKSIGKQASDSVSRKDYWHMRIIELSGRLCFLLSLVLCTYGFLFIPVILIAYSLMVRWLLMHHIGHGGYNKIANIPKQYHSKRYAIGWRRYIDWFDWIKADAWNYEHNYLHHYFTGEQKDPDLVEENLQWLANMSQPRVVKIGILLFFAVTWKFTYYSAQTLSVGKNSNKITFSNFFDVRHSAQKTMWLELFIPYLLVHFVLMSLVLEFISPGAGLAYLTIRLFAEGLHNFHTFFIIVPNHCGDDLFRFHDVSRQERGGDDFYLRQIKGSANFYTGNEWLDLSQMYLNYQIEHHLFPALPMRQYRLIQPQIKAVCKKYNVPYVQESVWKRSWKMLDIATGKTQMLTEKTQ